MATESLVIEFQADVSQLNKASQSLEAIGAISKQQADTMTKAFGASDVSAKKLNETIKQLEKEEQALLALQKQSNQPAIIKQLDDALIKVRTDMAAVTKETQNLNGSAEKLSNTFKNVANSVQFNAAKDQVQKFGNELNGTVTKATRLTTELRNLRQRLSELEQQGKTGTAEFTKLAIAAGRLQDQIGDTANRVRVLASDTKNLDASLSIASGIAGSFAIAQGAAALFGKENEDLQKALLKVQASLAILNGLQAVSATFNKDSAASVVIMSNAQKAYNFVVGSSTGALKGFKIALAATGIGLFVIALVSIIANFDKVKSKLTGLFPELNKFGAFWDKVKHSVNGFLDATIVAIGQTALLVGHLLSFQFGKAVEDAREFGKEVGKAYVDGRNESLAEQEARQARETDALLVSGLDRNIALREAKGQEVYELQLEQFDKQLKIIESELGKQSAEYLDKLNERNVLIAQRDQELLDKQKEFLDKYGKAGSLKFFQAQLKDAEEALQNAVVGSGEFEAILRSLIKAQQDAAKAQEELNKQLNAVRGDVEMVKLSVPITALPEPEEDPEFLHFRDVEKLKTEFQKEETKLRIQQVNEIEDEARAQQFEAAVEFANQLFSLGQTIGDARIAEIQRQADAGVISEKKAEAEIRKIKRQQAIADKAAALFNIAIQTATAVAKVTAQTGIAAPFLIPLMIAIGVAQAAIVASKPIPAFAKGTDKAPPGWKLVGEEGPELINDNGGYKILPNDQTEKMLAAWQNMPSINAYPETPYISNETMNRMEYNNHMKIDYEKLSDMIAEKLSAEIDKHPKYHWTVNEKGFLLRVIQKGNEMNDIGGYYRS